MATRRLLIELPDDEYEAMAREAQSAGIDVKTYVVNLLIERNIKPKRFIDRMVRK